MDIYEYLKLDHKKVAKLFDLFETAKTEKNKLETFQLIKLELLIHADSESKTFYTALESKRNDGEKEVLHGEEEHMKIKELLAEISEYKKVTAKMESKVLELKKLVEHHVSDEEGRMFRVAKEIFNDDEAHILKFQMHDYKEKLMNAIETQEELATTI